MRLEQNAANLGGIDKTHQGSTKDIAKLLGFNSLTNYQFVHLTDIGRDYNEIMGDIEKEWQRIDNEYDIPYYPQLQFKAVIGNHRNATVKIATSGMYNLFVNGEFICYGSARAGKNHFRMDEIDVSEHLNKEDNAIIIEVAAYNVNSFAIQKQPAFFEAYENSDGLLESVTGWNFIEWSKANDFVSGVSYPTNMLYSAALKAASELYLTEKYVEKSNNVKEKIIKQSFNGKFFIDNAERIDGKLILRTDISEVCQYYAFLWALPPKKLTLSFYVTFQKISDRKEKNEKPLLSTLLHRLSAIYYGWLFLNKKVFTRI